MKKLRSMDSISLLPDSIAQEILFYLSADDAVRTSVLSKSWNRVWNSLPILDFNLGRSISQGFLPCKPGDRDRNETLVSRVDRALLRLHNEKVRFGLFKFELIFSNDEIVSDTDLNRWIELIARNPIERFRFKVFNKQHPEIFCKLPRSVFAINSLTSLTLQNCEIQEASIGEDLKFYCLRKLNLFAVRIDEVLLQKLLDSCPILEMIYFFSYRSKLMKHLRLLKCPSLKRINISFGIRNIQIQSLNLETLFLGRVVTWELNKAAWGNLKELSVDCPSITSYTIEQVIRDCPLLEVLSFMTMSKKIRVSSRRLERLCLKMSNYADPLSIEIDASNLCHCSISTYHIPSEFMITSSKLQETQFDSPCIFPSKDFETSWFINLRRYLSKIQMGELTIRLSLMSRHCCFRYEELSGIKLPPLPILGTMFLYGLSDAANDLSFLQGMLWSCRPRTLNLLTSSPKAMDFAKFVFEALMLREEDAKCCGENEIKCWKHHLKHVEAYYNGSPIQQFPTIRSDQNIRFNLIW